MHAQEVAKQAAAARQASSTANADTDDDEYTPAETTIKRNLVLATMRGTLVDFLDEFERLSETHTLHRHLVSTKRKASISYDKNVRPLIVKRDIDFSENGSMKNYKQLQSQYWVTIMYTLFVSVVSWLLASEWNREEGLLKKGDEVTVYGEKAGQPINLDSFWGVVTGVIDPAQGKYEITDENECKHHVNRPDLRLRKRHTKAFGHVSDDKVHDRLAMQHFTKQELEELEKYMKQYFPDDIPHGRILRLHQHSNNASQHVKNTGALYFFTCLTTGIIMFAAYIYTFGAPGHGKGPWDGIGGRWKSKVDQCSSSSETQGRLSYTDSGYIQSVKDVVMAIQYHFERGEQRHMQLAGKNHMHGCHFFYVHSRS